MSKTRNLSDLLDANGDVKATALDNTVLQTDAEIKTAYENNSDTNAFTDAEQTKLSGIETGATADQTASEILTAIKTVDGTGSGLDADLLDGNEASAFATSAQGSTADSALQNVSEDTTPQLGGDLDLNSNDVTGTGNINITGTLQTSSNAIIGGDLTVSGTTTTVNTETINLADNNIVLNSNHTGTPTQNAGITIERGTSTDKVFQWNESSDYWETDDNFNVTGNITVSGTVDGRDIAADGTTLDAVASTYVDVSGDTLTGDLAFGDNVKATFGDLPDLQIYHTGTNSIINEVGAGNLVLSTNGTQVRIAHSTNAETMAEFNKDGSVLLKYDGSDKLETTSTGIDVTGTVTADGLTVSQATSPTITINDTDSVLPLTITQDGANGSILLGSAGSLTLGVTNNSSSDALNFQTKSTTRINIADTGDISFYDDAGTSQDFYWDASTSRLGLGTTSPSYQLHVGGTTDNTVAQFKSTDDTSQILISDDDTNGYLGVRNDFIYISPTSSTGADGLVVRTDTGNVGIGTTSPDSPLQVDRASTDGDIVTLSKDGTTHGSIGYKQSDLYIAGGTGIGFRGVGIYSTDSTGTLTDNSSDIGASSFRWKDLYLSGDVISDGSVTSNVDINAQTGTTYTTVLADRSKLVTLDNASAVTVTIPPNSSVSYPTGTKIDLLAKGAGQVTVAEGSGVTVNSAQSLKLRAQWSAASVIKLATDTWVLVGDLQAV